MTKSEGRNPKDETGDRTTQSFSTFRLRISFVIPHSSFNDLCKSGHGFRAGRTTKPAGAFRRRMVGWRAHRMKILSVHAHFDDYEFTAAGTFEMWKRKLGGQLRAKVIVCTDGKAGHQFRTRDETGKIRLREQLASAKIGGYEFEQLRYPNGE